MKGIKLDIGSGPRDYWISEDEEWIHLDKDNYPGVVQWEWPRDRIPMDDETVDEVWIGQLFIELERDWLAPLAMEVHRVCKKGAKLRVHCYGNERSGRETWQEFFGWLEQHDWVCRKEEIVNKWEEGQTWLIEMEK